MEAAGVAKLCNSEAHRIPCCGRSDSNRDQRLGILDLATAVKRIPR
ncbi:hypothetical protein SAMN05660971_01436 [Halomonas cupida]|uniref:Uncharacterized protein n=1 Tax=Halomonas cupida TaxID=44933 RepID=A0A1M7DQB2_9GAMM|nr:hypothetical protein SAMN05660971_01436 [Halomonas cupida]